MNFCEISQCSEKLPNGAFTNNGKDSQKLQGDSLTVLAVLCFNLILSTYYHYWIGPGDCPGEVDNQVGAGDHGGRGGLGEDLVDATLLGNETYQRVC